MLISERDCAEEYIPVECVSAASRLRLLVRVPPQDLSQAPQLVSTTANGSLYLAVAQEYNQVHILHVYGTPYQMGFAHLSFLGACHVADDHCEEKSIIIILNHMIRDNDDTHHLH